MFKNMGGNIPGGNLMGGNFPGRSFPDTKRTISNNPANICWSSA